MTGTYPTWDDLQVSGSAQWQNTTHQWKRSVDLDHLAHVRRRPGDFAPGGVCHLVLEVVAYAAEEAADQVTGRCHITLHSDESISVADNGRGTDTRFDDEGRAIKKPVMATRDLRFFDFPDAQRLPDGHPRRGMSVVAALSEWLVTSTAAITGRGSSATSTASPSLASFRSRTTAPEVRRFTS